MKFHATASTIVISLFIAAIFLSISVFVLLSLNMTSPTLMLTNHLFESWTNSNSDVSIEFDSIERNLRDRVFVNGLKLGYKGEDVLYFDKLEVKRGLFSLITYALSGNGVVSITAENGSVNIPTIESNAQGGGSSTNLQDILSTPFTLVLPEEIFTWGLEIDFKNVDISYNNINANGVNLYLYFDHSLDDFMVDIALPHFEYETSSFSVGTGPVDLALSYNNGFKLDTEIEKLSFYSNGLSANISKIALKSDIGNLSSTAIKDIPFSISIDGVEVDGNGILAKLEQTKISWYASIATMQAKKLVIDNSALDATVESIKLTSYDFNAFKLSIDSSLVELDNGKQAYIEKLDGNIDLRQRLLHLNTPKAVSDITSAYTNDLISSVALSYLDLDLDYSSGIKVGLSSLLSMESPDKILNSITSSLSLLLSYNESGLKYSFNLDDISIPGMDFGFYLIGSGDNHSIDLGLKYLNQMDVLVSISNTIELNAIFNSFKLNEISEINSYYASAFTSYISDFTELNGAISSKLKRDSDAIWGYSGSIGYDLALNNIRFNDYSFNMSSTLDAKLEFDSLIFNQFRIHSDILDINYSGSLDIPAQMPEGDFSITGAKGEEYFLLDIDISSLKEYSFYAYSPYLDDSYISGVVNYAENGVIVSDAVFTLFNRINPFELRIELENNLFQMKSDRFLVQSSWKDMLEIALNFNDLPLSPSDKVGDIITLFGDFNFSFDFARQYFEFTLPSLGVRTIGESYNDNGFSFSAHGDNNSIEFEDIYIKAEGHKLLSGSAFIDIEQRSFALHAMDDVREEYMLSIIKDANGFFGIARGDNIDLERFGINSMVGNINLTGSAETLSEFAFSGSFDARAVDEEDERKINASLFINNSQIVLNNLNITNEKYKVSASLFSFNGISGEGRVDDIALSYIFDHVDKDYIVDGGLDCTFKLPGQKSLIDSIWMLIKTRGNGASFGINVDHITMDNSLGFEDRECKGEYINQVINLSGELIEGFFDLRTKEMDLSINLDPIASFTVKGFMGQENRSELNVDIDRFAVSLANIYFKTPILIFYDPAYLYGNINIQIDESGINAFGYLHSDYAEFDVWWLPDERVILHNATFVIWDNDITSNLTDATVLNTRTYEKIPGQVRLGMYFDDQFAFDSWDLDVYIDDPYTVDFRMPVVSSNMDITGKVAGHFGLYKDSRVIKNFGEVRVDDTVLSVGMHPLPSWWSSSSNTEVDFDLILRKNARFIYPLGPNPILRANIADDTHVRYMMDSENGIRMNGDISLRSGEIFYFQKNFYITNGNIGFNEGSSGIDPIINLRARLRDFDAEGESVDIYLILRDTTLNNINPTFESSPSKDINEIMSILGQAILPTAAYGDTSLTTVVSMAAASLDLLSRVGVFGSMDTGLNSTIRDSLSIDVFSLHTNILTNLLTDTVSIASSTRGYNTLSPMARYLDGTTLYIGKNINPSLYFQAMVHLSADRRKNKDSFSFIADDLIMDTELSLEWNNPLCTVTFFSQPMNLTPYEIIDNFGFSLTKRIVF